MREGREGRSRLHGHASAFWGVCDRRHNALVPPILERGVFLAADIVHSSKKSVSTALISYTCLVLTPTP